ncbi:MAG TPA: hypothetical protein VIJ47_11615 [Acidimicrobiales bacterium]
MIVARVLAVLFGTLAVLWVLWSAIRAVVVPRGESVWLSRKVFLVIREAFEFAGRRTRSYEAYDRVMARYAPTSLVILPGVWALIVFTAFIPIFWGIGVGSWRLAVTTSGSSLTTLGFDRPPGLPAEVACFVEALIGLFLVALLISYLPAIYSAFSHREALVVKLEVRAGSPPSAETFLTRISRIRGLDALDDTWDEWEQWFVELEESHTSQPSLPFFRSPRPDSSWITAAGAVMDTAALSVSCLDVERNPQAQVTIRAGYLALRAISAFFQLPFDPDPAPDAPISIDRAEFDELMIRLAAEGLPLKADLDQAWRDFAGWRVNYDQPLLRLCALVSAPPAPWSSDRIDRIGPARALRLGRGPNGPIGPVLE